MSHADDPLQPYAINDAVQLSYITQGHIVSIAKELKLGMLHQCTMKAVVSFLMDRFGIVSTEDAILSIIKEYRKLCKSGSTLNGARKLLAFYALRFADVVILSAVSSASSSATVDIGVSYKTTAAQRTARVASRVGDIESRAAVGIQSRVNDLESENAMLKKRFSITRSRLNYWRNKCRRERKQSEEMRSKVKSLKKLAMNPKKVRALTRQLQAAVAKKLEINNELKSVRMQYQLEIANMTAVITEYDNKLCILQEELVKWQNRHMQFVTKSNSGKYVDSIRKSVYFCTRKQVPIASVSSVIGYLSKELFGFDLSPLPSAASVFNMTNEMRVLSMVQAADAVLKSQYVNLGWDATSIDARHVNEVHVSTDSGSFLLDVGVLAGGTAADYMGHIQHAIEETVRAYCKVVPLREFDDVLTDIKTRVTSAISDRAIVNHSVIRELEKYLGHGIIELNCNVHPLDSLSAAFRKLTKLFEQEHGVQATPYCSDSILVRVVLNVSKMRFKQGKGDPNSMRAFFELKNIDRQLIIRYIGNRFHVLFHLCESIYYLRPDLVDYLETCCSKSAKYRSDILSDLSLEFVLMEMQVGGLLGKTITGPWMKCLYRNSSLNNLGSCALLQTVVEHLRQLVATPRLLWDREYNGFGLERVEDLVHDSLCRKEPTVVALDFASRAANEFLMVIERQAARYLTGGELALLDQNMKDRVANAPADNIAAESILGLADRIMRRAPNATDAHVASKTMFAINNTTDFMVEISPEMISRAVRQARVAKQQSSANSKKILDEIQSRLETKGQERANTRRKQLSKSIKAIMQDPQSFAAKIGELQLGIDQTLVDHAFNIICAPNDLLNSDLKWVWNENGVDILYNYQIMRRRKQATEVQFVAAHWEDNSTFDTAEDIEFTLDSLITDFLAGDLWFV